MSVDLKGLQEQRNALGAKIREFGDKCKDGVWECDESRAAFDKANEEYDAISSQIDGAVKLAEERSRVTERIERIKADDERAIRTGANIPGREDRTNYGSVALENRQRTLAMQAWFRGEAETEEERDACARFKVTANSKRINLGGLDHDAVASITRMCRRHQDVNEIVERMLERRDGLTSTDFDAGGSLVPTSFMPRLETMMLKYGDLLSVADTMVTENGNIIDWPTMDDTANTGGQISELTNMASGVLNPLTGSLQWSAYDLTSFPVVVSERLLEDSPIALSTMLPDMLGERLGRILHTKCTTGTGGGATFRGIVTASTLGVTTASGSAITLDEIIDLQHSVPFAYRSNNALMMHDSVVKYLRKLKDGENRYIWVNGTAPGLPDSIIPGTQGTPMRIVVNQDMASSVATTNKTILCGDFSRYKIRRVRGISLRRLDETYATTRQVGFVAFMRADGNLLENSGAGTIRHMLQA